MKVSTAEIVRSLVGNNFINQEKKRDYLARLKKSCIKLKSKLVEEFPELKQNFEFEQLYLPYNYILSFFQQKEFWTVKEINTSLHQLERTCKIWLLENAVMLLKEVK